MGASQPSNVAEAVWNWRAPKSAAAGDAPARRRKALVQFGVATAFAALLLLRHHRVAGLVVGGIGVAVLLCGLWVPPAFEALDRLGRALGRWVGAALTYLLLVPFFYLVMVPGRLILAASGKDPMKRRWDRAAASYWVDPNIPAGVDRFKRQY